MALYILGAIIWWAQALAYVLMFISVILILLVLLQKGKGGGLSAAFGGAGGQSAFGSKTGDVFTWTTIVIVAVYLLLTMVLTMTFKPHFTTSRPMDTISSEGATAPTPQEKDAAQSETTEKPANDAPAPVDAPAATDAAAPTAPTAA
ncbi:MAG: preprotein translocase subunit SecG, partial [Sedimentisphaerales bacterium]|nr:preprotein translocase subunit SecG [Sedimentisphaerales bacterium]